MSPDAIDVIKLGFKKVFDMSFEDSNNLDYVEFIMYSHKLEEEIKHTKNKGIRGR